MLPRLGFPRLQLLIGRWFEEGATKELLSNDDFYFFCFRVLIAEIFVQYVNKGLWPDEVTQQW